VRALTLFAAVALVSGCTPAPMSPMPRGDGDSCGKPFRLQGTTPLAITATTAGFTDDEGSSLSSCGGSAAPDLVFTFQAAINAIVDVSVFPEDPGFQPIVKLRGAAQGCVAPDDACDSAIARGQPAEVKNWVPSVGGLQYVIVDGLSMTSGRFSLEVEQR
jgi:hypothetical protein